MNDDVKAAVVQRIVIPGAIKHGAPNLVRASGVIVGKTTRELMWDLAIGAARAERDVDWTSLTITAAPSGETVILTARVDLA